MIVGSMKKNSLIHKTRLGNSTFLHVSI